MSERRILQLFLACSAVAVAVVVPVQAQDVEQLRRHEAELLARRDGLVEQVAREAEGRFRSERRTVLAVGPLRVAYPEWASVAANNELSAALEAEVRRYGTAVDSLLADTVYIWVDEPAPERHVARMKFRVGSWTGTREVGIDSTRPGAWVSEMAVAALDEWAMQSLLDLRLSQWLGRLDQRNTVASLRDPIVRDLVSSPSSRARRCLDGSPDDCRLLLELDEGATPLLEAYDRADLPGLFDRMDLNDRIPGRANCIGKRDTIACADLVREGRALPPHPVGSRARQSLFAYAIATGGEGAWLRLYRAKGLPVAEQLGAASGKPVDSLLVSWQQDLRAGRRTTTAGLAPSLFLALSWSVVGILLFAWRYRWRHV
ncbi:MAG TPA: hypothetical protein VF454_03815 [Gemmatimonadales bacterium]